MEQTSEPYAKEINVLDHGYVRYVDHLGSDQRVVESARVSYHSKSKSKGEEADRKLLERLYRDRHTSPFEMVKLTLNLKMPIFIARQYVRHRMQNLNEVSARYSELPAEFYIPEKWRKQDTSKTKQGSIEAEKFNNQWVEYSNLDLSEKLKVYCHKAYQEYQEYLDFGVAREMARMVLPVNIYTEMYVTWDLKNLLHFLTLREDPHAQWEHQQYGLAIKSICVDLFPWTMEAYEKYKWKLDEKISYIDPDMERKKFFLPEGK